MRVLHIISSFNFSSAYEENHTIDAHLALGFNVLVASAQLSNLPSNLKNSINHLSFRLLNCIRIGSDHVLLLGLNSLVYSYKPDMLYLHGLDTFSFYFLSFSPIPSTTLIFGDIHESGIHPLYRVESTLSRLKKVARSFNYFFYLKRLKSISTIFYSSFTRESIYKYFTFLNSRFVNRNVFTFPMPSSQIQLPQPYLHSSFIKRHHLLKQNRSIKIILAGKFTLAKCIAESVELLVISAPASHTITIFFAGFMDTTSKHSLQQLYQHYHNLSLKFLGSIEQSTLASMYQECHASAWITNVSVGVNESLFNLCPVITSCWGTSFYPAVPACLVFDDHLTPFQLSSTYDHLLDLWDDPGNLVDYFDHASSILDKYSSALSIQKKLLSTT